MERSRRQSSQLPGLGAGVAICSGKLRKGRDVLDYVKSTLPKRRKPDRHRYRCHLRPRHKVADKWIWRDKKRPDRQPVNKLADNDMLPSRVG